jgi:hypothetical protein
MPGTSVPSAKVQLGTCQWLQIQYTEQQAFQFSISKCSRALASSSRANILSGTHFSSPFQNAAKRLLVASKPVHQVLSTPVLHLKVQLGGHQQLQLQCTECRALQFPVPEYSWALANGSKTSTLGTNQFQSSTSKGLQALRLYSAYQQAGC